MEEYLNRNATPQSRAEEIGMRLKQARLNKDISQVKLSEMSGLERRIILKAEQGDVSLVNMIAILEALGKDDELSNFLPPQPISPIQLLRLQGKKRIRASGEHTKNKIHKNSEDDLGW